MQCKCQLTLPCGVARSGILISAIPVRHLVRVSNPAEYRNVESEEVGQKSIDGGGDEG